MGLDRLSVLVVEDHSFARNMIAEILRAMKVGRVVTASDGTEAIGMLRQASKHRAAQVLGFDFILSDYLMSPINGSMLLRWVRQHDDSPDRFIPFVMISGVADGDVVREARDMGTTEFLAKPFSVKSIGDHIQALIDSPRPFIYTNAYFGPERRRRKSAYNAADRRITKPEETEVVYSTSRLKKPDPNIKVFYFKLPNRLREKVMGLGSKGGPMVIDPEILKAAEQQLDRMEGDYSDWVRGTVKQLAEAYEKAVADHRAAVGMVAQINRISHDLRGQGTTFGYPLITVFGTSLYDATAKIDKVPEKLLDFIKAHIDGITAVIREKIKGSGGAIGTELVESLERARERLANTI